MPEVVMKPQKASDRKPQPLSSTSKKVDEPEVVRKKKKLTQSTTPVSTDKRLDKASKKLSTLRSQSIELEAEADSLDLDSHGGPEAVFKKEYVKMLKFNARLIKRLNEQLQTQLSSRDIYALSTLMSQQREVIADLRTIVDMSDQVDMVQRQVLVPLVSDMTQLITDIYFQLRKVITETSIPKQTQFALQQLDELVKQFGTGLHSAQASSKDRLFQILLGETEPATAKKRKR